MSRPSSISANILRAYYSNVADLHTYLGNIIALPSDCPTDDAVLRPTDSAKFREFAAGSYVASNIPYVDLPGGGRARFSVVEPYVYMHDLIDRAQEKLLNNKVKVKNVITEGYRLNKGEGHIGRTRVGVSNLFVNTNITALQCPEWERLLPRIGEDAMFHLLTETCVFVPLPNDCLCQLTGEPIVSHKVPFPSGSRMASILPSTESATRLDAKRGSHSTIEERSLKRPRIASDRDETRGPVEIVFSRARLFYARPSYVPHTTFIVAGLPLQHIFNRLRPSYGPTKKTKMGMTKQDIERAQMEDARHLAKYIFPRQYGLSNAFTPTSTPRWGAGKLPDYADREDEIKGKSLKTPKRFACGYNEVFRYAVLVTKAVIPKALWGSDENFKVMMNSVKDFVTFRRFETVSLHHVLQGLSTISCKWLAPDASTSTGKRHLPASDNLKRRELLEEFVFWYFNSFLLPLLRTTFYVTESSAFRNRTLYFRQDDWHVLCAPLVDRLTGSTFLKLGQTEAEEILRQRVLGSSFVRLLPKDTGVRPIVNLSRKESQQAAAFLILTYEREARPELVGSAVFGLNEIHRRLKSFKAHLLSTHSPAHLPKLYFVKVDVQACFDTIEQKRLLQILKDAITEDSYMLQRYGKVNQTAGKIQRKFIKRAIPSGKFCLLESTLASSDRSQMTILISCDMLRNWRDYYDMPSSSIKSITGRRQKNQF
ncbi:hypothetical protein EWM64_g5960 [Hericium alpestre]|uniref:Telomerase reverse transcriptase n=1 Tax=Hericium alpestre TaxID=135208 RepID=A0A4Y9ZVY2_9AGAM|nr:hypothetical protein EWM64_g5960 [Hericium alpestre]